MYLLVFRRAIIETNKSHMMHTHKLHTIVNGGNISRNPANKVKRQISFI